MSIEWRAEDASEGPEQAPASDARSAWTETVLTGLLTALAIMLVSLAAVATGLV